MFYCVIILLSYIEIDGVPVDTAAVHNINENASKKLYRQHR